MQLASSWGHGHDATHPLRFDLTKLEESADQLLGQIDAVTALARPEEAATVHGSGALKLELVADVLRAVEPLLQTEPAKQCSRAVCSLSTTMRPIAACSSAGWCATGIRS